MTNSNYSKLRQTMVKQQLEPLGISSPKILNLMGQLPREKFIPEGYERLAYVDEHIYTEEGHSILPATFVARALEALNIQSDDRILEIGSGTGYVSAILASLGKHLTTVDINPSFVQSAEHTLTEMGFTNIDFDCGNAAFGWDHNGPFDIIFISAAYYTLPEIYRQLLVDGGKLFAVIGQWPLMHAWRITRKNQTHYVEDALFEARIPYMEKCLPPEVFKF